MCCSWFSSFYMVKLFNLALLCFLSSYTLFVFTTIVRYLNNENFISETKLWLWCDIYESAVQNDCSEVKLKLHKLVTSINHDVERVSVHLFFESLMACIKCKLFKSFFSSVSLFEHIISQSCVFMFLFKYESKENKSEPC